MEENDRFEHARIVNTALPYITNASLTEPRPHFISGSHDTLGSIRGWLERRPGFPVYTADDFAALGGRIDRWFTWQRWDGAFYLMLSVSLPGAVPARSRVYKQKIGTDVTFQVLFDSTTTSLEPFDFVEANNFVFFGNGVDMKKYDGTTVTNWGINPQPITPPLTADMGAGSVPAAIGHRYLYSYGVSATGYISDVSDPSALLSVMATITTPLRQWDITGPKCTDTQCDQVHIYRTEDGGSVYLELPNSPIPNPAGATWTIRDNATDFQLQQSSPAPFPGVNDKPTPMNGFRFFAGRIWGFKNDTVYFSTFEENTTSVPEECWGQVLTNSRTFGSQVLGLAKTPDFILVFTTRGIYRIGGDSLNTFSYSQLSANLGVRNRAAITEFDNKVAWLDMSNTIQATDGYTVARDDLSLAIRPDIESINHALASLTSFSTARNKWLVLCDGGSQKLRVLDLALGQWNPPWSISSIDTIGSGQIAAGIFKLFLGRAGKPLAMDFASFLDEAAAFIAESYMSLVQMNADNPTSVGVMEYVGVERNAIALSDVGALTDEDPATGVYTSIFANESEPANRINGTALVEKWYWANTPAAQRVSCYLKWAAANTKFILYTLDVIKRKVN